MEVTVYEIMNNFALNVRATTKESLIAAVKLAFAHSPGGKMRHWAVCPEYGLVLFWHDESGSKFHGQPIHEYPFELTADTAAEFVWQWLRSVDREKFTLKGMDALYDDGDVRCETAYRVFVEDWGHVGGSAYAICAVLPCWAWLGK